MGAREQFAFEDEAKPEHVVAEPDGHCAGAEEQRVLHAARVVKQRRNGDCPGNEIDLPGEVFE